LVTLIPTPTLRKSENFFQVSREISWIRWEEIVWDWTEGIWMLRCYCIFLKLIPKT
jgi:hypothetical protein